MDYFVCKCCFYGQAELDFALKEYVGRETPLYYAERLSQYYKR